MDGKMWNRERYSEETTENITLVAQWLTFKRRIKSRLPFAGIIRSSPNSTRFQGKG